jgi:hypothetical protein
MAAEPRARSTEVKKNRTLLWIVGLALLAVILAAVFWPKTDDVPGAQNATIGDAASAPAPTPSRTTPPATPPS